MAQGKGLTRKTPLKAKAPLNRKKPVKKHLRKDGTVKRGYTKTGKPSAKTLLNKADQLAGAACRARGECQAKGWAKWKPAKSGMGEGGRCWGLLSWCHIQNRDDREIRHDPRNCLCLCAGCHKYFHDNEREFSVFIETIDPGVTEYIRSELLAWGEKPVKDLRDVYEYWIKFYKDAE